MIEFDYSIDYKNEIPENVQDKELKRYLNDRRNA